MTKVNMIIGRRAIEHAIDEHISVEKIFIGRYMKGPFEKMIRHVCRDRRIPLSYVEKAKLDKLSRRNHQGVIAFVSPIHYQEAENLLLHAIEQTGFPLFVMANGVTDVGNIGAIARSCEVLGASGLILPTDGSAMINDHAMKTSAGAFLQLPVGRTNSLVNLCDFAISSGYVLMALDGHGDTLLMNITSIDRPTILIVGDEHTGVSKALLQRCEMIVCIHQSGQVESLNVSVATGIALYQLTRHRIDEIG